MKSYPVNLLLCGRRCLVVGGGAVARRKVLRLLESGAEVKVVALSAVSELKKLSADGRIELISRRFSTSDLEGIFLAFFATSDSKLNYEMLRAARQKKILTCAVDENWAQGDFITPASCSGAGLQIAVTTDGSSCSQAKAVKEIIKKQLGELAGSTGAKMSEPGK